MKGRFDPSKSDVPGDKFWFSLGGKKFGGKLMLLPGPKKEVVDELLEAR